MLRKTNCLKMPSVRIGDGDKMRLDAANAVFVGELFFGGLETGDGNRELDAF